MLIVPVQHLAAGLGHQDEVLHADAELAGQVDTRLNRKDHAGSGYGGVRAADVALLVVGLADEMPQTVVEIRAVARFRNQVARGGIQLTQAHAGLDERLGSLIRAAHQIMHGGLLFSGLAAEPGAGHVAAIAALHAAHVKQHAVALF